jgi:hypothetical protein
MLEPALLFLAVLLGAPLSRSSMLSFADSFSFPFEA